MKKRLFEIPVHTGRTHHDDLEVTYTGYNDGSTRIISVKWKGTDITEVMTSVPASHDLFEHIKAAADNDWEAILPSVPLNPF